MISEIKQRAWLVSTASPAKAQYYSGQVDGSWCFSCNWKQGIPLTYSESERVKVELKQAFIRRAEEYQVIHIGDVAEFRPTFSLITGQHFIRVC